MAKKEYIVAALEAAISYTEASSPVSIDKAVEIARSVYEVLSDEKKKTDKKYIDSLNS